MKIAGTVVSILALAGALPLAASARDFSRPLEDTGATVVQRAEPSPADEAIASTNPAPAPAASRPSAPAATPPKPEAERRMRRAERLDRPPYVRPM